MYNYPPIIYPQPPYFSDTTSINKKAEYHSTMKKTEKYEKLLKGIYDVVAEKIAHNRSVTNRMNLAKQILDR